MGNILVERERILQRDDEGLTESNRRTVTEVTHKSFKTGGWISSLITWESKPVVMNMPILSPRICHQHHLFVHSQSWSTFLTVIRHGIHDAPAFSAHLDPRVCLEISIQINPDPSFPPLKTGSQLLHFKNDNTYQHAREGTECVSAIENVYAADFFPHCDCRQLGTEAADRRGDVWRYSNCIECGMLTFEATTAWRILTSGCADF